MKPNVKVVSEAGPSVTTINASGQPCTDNNYCSKRTGNKCSVVTFGSSHTLISLLDGFTITGGGGLDQSPQVAAGGIYIFSTATVQNNIITNNQPISTLKQHYGAGIYISLGAPVITNNVIEGNRLIPPNGQGQTASLAYGAGIYVGFYSSPEINDNVIRNNMAGDPNLSNSIGGGGGLAVFPAGVGAANQVISRNLIEDNMSKDLGGGIHVLGLVGADTPSIITNNVIVGNLSGQGGGMYAAYAPVTFINNTVSGNQSNWGGGAFLASLDATLPVIFENNVVEGNFLAGLAGSGGGLYTFNLTSGISPSIQYNDLFGNQLNEIDGDFTEGSTIGTNGNVSADPLFVDKPARDFHIAAASPAIDTAFSAAAPTDDFDSMPRGVDGDGTPGSPQPGDVDMGAFEFGPNCIPEPEICDGLDNDCDQVVDNGFPDTDSDGLADCIDPDDDNDSVADVSDCAPLDPGSFGMPTEVINLNVDSNSPTRITYDVQNIGPNTQYEIVSGLITRMSATASLDEDFCIGTGSSAGQWFDSRPSPRPDDAWFYLMRSVNACGNGSLGGGVRDTMRAAGVCQNAIVDADFDGSPVDLDCIDTDPNNAPINAEVCDGLDNNCDTVPDDGNPGGGVQCGLTNTGTCQFGLTDCQGGGLVCMGAVYPGPEFCDGLDNDCDGIPDNNVIDTDNDGLDDCVDTNDDNDPVEDVLDCAPLDATAWGFPAEIADLDIIPGAPASLTWSDQNIGTGTLYDVGTGEIDSSGVITFSAGACQGSEIGSPAMDSQPTPPAGSVVYYVVKARNACSASTYGSPARDTLPICP